MLVQKVTCKLVISLFCLVLDRVIPTASLTCVDVRLATIVIKPGIVVDAKVPIFLNVPKPFTLKYLVPLLFKLSKIGFIHTSLQLPARTSFLAALSVTTA